MDPSFDRGEIDRASLDATERLRARLSGTRPASPPPPGRSVLPWVIAGSLFVFTAGMIANPWFERSVRSQLAFDKAGDKAENVPVIAAEPAPAVVAIPAIMPPGERLARTEARIETSAEQLARDAERIDTLTREVAALSARVEAETGRTAQASATAIAAADRAQGMIAVLLARDAITAGRRLNGIEPVLRQSFEARYPQAITAIAALGAAPVTLAGLRRDFAGLDPAITGEKLDWWQSLTSAVKGAVSRAGDGDQSPHQAAAAALARGDVAGAANYLRRLPAPRSAGLSAWLASAERLQAGLAGLTTLETAAIMPPSVDQRAPNDYRAPNSALPTRTTVAPSIAADS